jgi:23S rRNA pseudouridine1911/1915/1917 synthase
MKTTFTVTQDQSGTRIDVLCAQKFPEISRTRWQKQGLFFCDGQKKKSNTKVRIDQQWSVECEEETMIFSSGIEPWNHELKILAESKTWVAIEKPQGISIHPSPSDQSDHTIVNALVSQFGKKLSSVDEDVSRQGIVHRLDKVTSGVLLVAKSNATHTYLQDHWSEVVKTYFAVVTGTPPAKGRIEGGILRDSKDRQKMAVSSSEKSRSAVTFFEVLEIKGDKSLLKINIPTGRTHQIRVHLSSIGFPIVGDTKYKGKPSDRVLLHAGQLQFPDPDKKGEVMVVDSVVPDGFWK